MTALVGSNEMSPIEIRGLTKRYGRLAALRGISLRIADGETVAVLGPNGAGKTTLMGILDGSAGPTAGAVRVLGLDPAAADPAWRQRLGVVTQRSTADPCVAVRDALAHRAARYRHPMRTGEVLELVGLAGRGGQLVGRLSAGELRRLDLALAVIGRPQLLLLDQPTASLDPAARHRAWRVLRRLAGAGTTMVLTTRRPHEAEALADRVVVMARGAVVADEDPHRLAEQQDGVVLRFRLPDHLDGAVLPIPAVRHHDHCVARSATPTRDVAVLCAWALDRRLELPAVEIVPPSFPEAYRTLTGEIRGDTRG
jgi:ABC-2 type transport system ATP-binding protein